MRARRRRGAVVPRSSGSRADPVGGAHRREEKSAADSAAHFTGTKNGGERAALLDITNESPIVGLAAGGLHDKIPPATATKTRPRPRRKDGSREALLRGQVKAVLHKVREEQGARFISFDELKKCTNNFSEIHEFVSGGYGKMKHSSG